MNRENEQVDFDCEKEPVMISRRKLLTSLGPFFSNIFTIFHQIGLLIDGDPVNGTTNKLKLVNGDFDRGANGVVITAGARGHTGQYTNITAQGETGYTGSDNVGFRCNGDSCDLDLVNADFRNYRGNAIRIDEGYCRVGIHNLSAWDWNLAATGAPAVYAKQYSNVKVTGMSRFMGGGSSLPFRRYGQDFGRACVRKIDSSYQYERRDYSGARRSRGSKLCRYPA
ncbi:hypothetical protein [Cohnella silvisoli]|uniref:Right-handed parallel beta-helix repeat-containing protein n=1 Tax=Cohnella silvisoli TaxID=2873699 RepID=A0ABV1L3K7_9BACL|nr:hypothetical protein [Cohnella silvisoli]MCD9026182.1 hypothetical protein [Cohnella silvisoli]